MVLAALPRTPWRRRLRQLGRAPPRAAVEDSVSLRAGVQGLVAIGIVAVDGAAGTAMSAWALPASLAGAAWSWYRRYRNNAAVKAAIALGMVLALAAFFGQLLGSLNDTRLVLARLLVQLQVLHSFDLPRRKDLGYSIAIRLILLGVAGTLAQTLAFAPLLLLFLALGLPVLVMHYRARLGLAAVPSQPGSAGWRQRLQLPLSL